MRSVPPEVSVQLLGSEAVVKEVYHIIVFYVGDGSSHVEEPYYVRSQGLATLLFAQAQVMASSWAMDGALKVVDEELFQIFPRVDRVMS